MNKNFIAVLSSLIASRALMRALKSSGRLSRKAIPISFPEISTLIDLRVAARCQMRLETCRTVSSEVIVADKISS